MSFGFTVFGRNFYVVIRKGYYKVMHDNGSFGYYAQQGFWKCKRD